MLRSTLHNAVQLDIAVQSSLIKRSGEIFWGSHRTQVQALRQLHKRSWQYPASYGLNQISPATLCHTDLPADENHKPCNVSAAESKADLDSTRRVRFRVAHLDASIDAMLLRLTGGPKHMQESVAGTQKKNPALAKHAAEAQASRGQLAAAGTCDRRAAYAAAHMQQAACSTKLQIPAPGMPTRALNE